MKKLNDSGFTLTEIIIVTAIIGILVAIAAPSVVQYLTNARYREANQALFSSFLDARQRAVSLNREVRVTVGLDAGAANENNTYVMEYVDGTPLNVVRKFPAGVEIRANLGCTVTTGTISLTFNPDGSSDLQYFCIMDGTNKKYRTGVNNGTTGRVVSQIWRANLNDFR